MTDGQLRSKRDEFWDTAPAFEGRKEIWDALKAAAYAAEANDHELAQAILDGASITLPHGEQQGEALSLQVLGVGSSAVMWGRFRYSREQRGKSWWPWEVGPDYTGSLLKHSPGMGICGKYDAGSTCPMRKVKVTRRLSAA